METLKSYIITVYHVTCNHPDEGSELFDVAICFNPAHDNSDIIAEIKSYVPSYYHTFDFSYEMVDGDTVHRFERKGISNR